MVRRSRNRRTESAKQAVPVGPQNSVIGGRLFALDKKQVVKIAEASFEILATIGLSEASDDVRELLRAVGCKAHNARILVPKAVTEKALKNVARPAVLAAQDPAWDLELSKPNVFTGSGGASPMVLDGTEFRASTLKDLAQAAQVCDALEHCHFSG